MDKVFKVAFIGCGQRARAHAAAVKHEPRCKVVALADIKRSAAEKVNERFEFGAEIYEDYNEMLAKEEIDLVIACLWPHLRLPVFTDCVKAGIKTVHAEKPMGRTWGECLDIARIASENQVQLTFCHQRRFAEGNLGVRKMLADGVFGKVIRMDLYSPHHLLDCGTHTFDQALSFNEENKVKWVHGSADVSEPISLFDVRAEGMAVGTLVFENGVRANIQVGGPDMDMWGGVRVIGTKGFVDVFWDGNLGRAVVYDDPSWKPPVYEANGEAQMIGVVQNVVDSMATGSKPVLDYRQALRPSEIIFSFYESIRRCQRITLPLTKVYDNPMVTMLDSGVLQTRRG